MDFFLIILGFVLLLVGRRLFWLFVGVLGFIYGMENAKFIFSQEYQWVTILLGLLLGILGALLAIFLQKIAIGLAGFISGGYLIFLLDAFLGLKDVIFWPLFVFSGLVGCVLGLILLDWALIIFSSLLGAILIVENIHFFPLPFVSVVCIILIVVGFTFQAKGLEGRRSVASKKEKEGGEKK